HWPSIVASGFLREALRLAPALRRDRRTQGFLKRDVHGMELVIARDLLDELALEILKHNKMPEEIEKTALLEYTLQHHLQFGELSCVVTTGDRAPRLEPFLTGAERTDP